MILSTEELAALRREAERRAVMNGGGYRLSSEDFTTLDRLISRTGYHGTEIPMLDYIDTLRQENAAMAEVNQELVKAAMRWCPFDLNDEDW